MTRRKNPNYGIIPLAVIAAVKGVSATAWIASGVGLATVGGFVGYNYAEMLEAQKQIKNYDGVGKLIQSVIKLAKDGELKRDDLIIPTLLRTPPTTERQAYFQASWGLLKAVPKLQGADRSRIIDLAETLWNKGESSSKSTLSASDPKLVEPLATAVAALTPFGASVEQEVTFLYTHQSLIMKDDQIKFEAQFDPNRYLKEAIVDTGKDIAFPFAVTAGLYG